MHFYHQKGMSLPPFLDDIFSYNQLLSYDYIDPKTSWLQLKIFVLILMLCEPLREDDQGQKPEKLHWSRKWKFSI